MNAVQRFFTGILPKKWAQNMERESRQWMIQCECGHERSYWDLGGIRWTAASVGKRILAKCTQCRRTGWMKVYRAAEVTIPDQ